MPVTAREMPAPARETPAPAREMPVAAHEMPVAAHEMPNPACGKPVMEGRVGSAPGEDRIEVTDQSTIPAPSTPHRRSVVAGHRALRAAHKTVEGLFAVERDESCDCATSDRGNDRLHARS